MPVSRSASSPSSTHISAVPHHFLYLSQVWLRPCKRSSSGSTGASLLHGGRTDTSVLPHRAALTIPLYDDLSREEALLGIKLDRESILQMRREVQQIMWRHVSLRRDQQGLLEARHQLHGLCDRTIANGSAKQDEEKIETAWLETVNMLKVADLLISPPLQRRER